jgi:hypothetical protein
VKVVLDAGLDAGPAMPEVIRQDQALEPDEVQREGPTLRLTTELRWLDLPPFPRLPEVNVEAAQRLRDSLSFALQIELTSGGRLRAVFDSEAFVLPAGTELRARDDHSGHILLWDAARKYTTVAPGTLRALLSEQRLDAAPVTKPKVSEAGTGNVLGMVTRKRELTTPLGRLVLEQASSNAAGSAGAGALLCRMLLELIAADPSNVACAKRELPLRAELFSSGGGRVLFEVQRIQKDGALDSTAFLTPPPEAQFVIGELPAHPSPVVPSPERLRELRTRPAPRSERVDPQAPKHGLLLQNRTESLRYVLLDGIVLARIHPRREALVEGLLPGKYALASLDFLGDDPTPLRIVELPARVALGEAIETER